MVDTPQLLDSPLRLMERLRQTADIAGATMASQLRDAVDHATGAHSEVRPGRLESALGLLEAVGGMFGSQWHVAAGVLQAGAISAHNSLLFPHVFPETPPPAPAVRQALLRRLVQLLKDDFANAAEGIYPRWLTASPALWKVLRAYPQFLAQLPDLRDRVRRNAFDAVPSEAEQYPAYYRRTFHYQPEGYLGDASARMYDAQVELLFGGTADAMRRQVIPPLVRAFRTRPADAPPPRVLDLACGTGSALSGLIAAWPRARYTGVDISPYYIAEARRRLARAPHLSLVVANGEELPFVDGSFDAALSVYLFHELPAEARDHVLRELARVVVPGGVVVIADSVQLSDTPDLAPALEQFPRQFHEPFYRQYLTDDMDGRLRAAGFEVVSRTPHLLTTVWECRRRVS